MGFDGKPSLNEKTRPSNILLDFRNLTHHSGQDRSMHCIKEESLHHGTLFFIESKLKCSGAFMPSEFQLT